MAPLRSWISCCKNREQGQSLFIGDIVALHPGEHYTYYHINCGVTTFDYSRRLNMIVTGGLDSMIRLWNPNAVNNKLVGCMEGHISPIVILTINNLRDQLISIAENKVTTRSPVLPFSPGRTGKGSFTFTLYLYHLSAETGVWNKVVLPLPFTFII